MEMKALLKSVESPKACQDEAEVVRDVVRNIGAQWGDVEWMSDVFRWRVHSQFVSYFHGTGCQTALLWYHFGVTTAAWHVCTRNPPNSHSAHEHAVCSTRRATSLTHVKAAESILQELPKNQGKDTIKQRHHSLLHWCSFLLYLDMLSTPRTSVEEASQFFLNLI